MSVTIVFENMGDYFTQVRLAANTKLYYLALAGALAIPDMCSGMETKNGETKGPLYIKWVDKYLSPHFTVGPEHTPSFSGKDCYGLRCSLLHQGHLIPHLGSYNRVLFVEPHSGPTLHNNVMTNATGSVLNIDIPIFVTTMVDAAEEWLTLAKDTPEFKANYPKYMHRYPNGYAPYIVGAPVIA